jgi:hypothetical protein
VDETNHLESVNTTILQSYSCVLRAPKQLLRIIVVVIAADISFMLFAYGVVMWLIETYEKRKAGTKDGELSR